MAKIVTHITYHDTYRDTHQDPVTGEHFLRAVVAPHFVQGILERRHIVVCNTLQHTATHCNTLQHTATHCNTLQHTATGHTREKTYREKTYRRMQHTTTHCNTLQQGETYQDTCSDPFRREHILRKLSVPHFVLLPSHATYCVVIYSFRPPKKCFPPAHTCSLC